MWKIPEKKYIGFPCSYVAAGCAYEDITSKDFEPDLPIGLHDDGYLTLNGADKFLRQFFFVKKEYFRRNDRVPLKDFLKKNTEPCAICVLGHFLYANGQDYWSFYDNDNDPVVCVWYLKPLP